MQAKKDSVSLKQFGTIQDALATLVWYRVIPREVALGVKRNFLYLNPEVQKLVREQFKEALNV